MALSTWYLSENNFNIFLSNKKINLSMQILANASYTKLYSSAGLGILTRNATGNFVGARDFSNKHVNLAEARAMLAK